MLCYLSFEGTSSSLLFFTGSQKNNNSNELHGLATRGSHATITAKLVSAHDETQWESLVKMNFPRDTRNFVVEFPGIIPATFLVLENIQPMQRISRLPFEKCIVPKLTTGNTLINEEIRVPPPLYARGAHLKFDLQSILKEATALALNPGSDNKDMLRKLEQSTSLDRGQCETPIAALTHEFVLIQGPPGTGKSYLGVQIVHVLIKTGL